MDGYIYLIVRTNETGEEKAIAACRSRERAEEYQAQLDELQELDALGWSYSVEPLKVSG